ncbi:TetR/AcrR family transcriptional regulator [Tepidicaulis sp. LMO-SS28]|uniref:TetR/AcrR family transcriptional regulator n=1 Tax=Tepidicaulis sp. LMO-SS28 TaxID=3447455 RepID=UPI003EDF5CB7
MPKGSGEKQRGLAAWREERQHQSRKAVLVAAYHLFAVRGFQRTSMVDIAKAAPASTATIYKHFASKELLLAGVVEDMFEDKPDVPVDLKRERNGQAHAFLSSMVMADARQVMRDLVDQDYQGPAMPVLEDWLEVAGSRELPRT